MALKIQKGLAPALAIVFSLAGGASAGADDGSRLTMHGESFVRLLPVVTDPLEDSRVREAAAEELAQIAIEDRALLDPVVAILTPLSEDAQSPDRWITYRPLGRLFAARAETLPTGWGVMLCRGHQSKDPASLGAVLDGLVPIIAASDYYAGFSLDSGMKIFEKYVGSSDALVRLRAVRNIDDIVTRYPLLAVQKADYVGTLIEPLLFDPSPGVKAMAESVQGKLAALGSVVTAGGPVPAAP